MYFNIDSELIMVVDGVSTPMPCASVKSIVWEDSDHATMNIKGFLPECLYLAAFPEGATVFISGKHHWIIIELKDCSVIQKRIDHPVPGSPSETGVITIELKLRGKLELEGMESNEWEPNYSESRCRRHIPDTVS